MNISSCSLRSGGLCSNTEQNTTPKEGPLVSAAALFTKIETPAVSTGSRCQGTFTVIGVRVRVGARINGVLASVRPRKGKYWDAKTGDYDLRQTSFIFQTLKTKLWSHNQACLGRNHR